MQCDVMWYKFNWKAWKYLKFTGGDGLSINKYKYTVLLPELKIQTSAPSLSESFMFLSISPRHKSSSIECGSASRGEDEERCGEREIKRVFCSTQCCSVCSASPTQWQKIVSADPPFTDIRASMFLYRQALVSTREQRFLLLFGFKKKLCKLWSFHWILDFNIFPLLQSETGKLCEPDWDSYNHCHEKPKLTSIMSPETSTNIKCSFFSFMIYHDICN